MNIFLDNVNCLKTLSDLSKTHSLTYYFLYLYYLTFRFLKVVYHENLGCIYFNSCYKALQFFVFYLQTISKIFLIILIWFASCFWSKKLYMEWLTTFHETKQLHHKYRKKLFDLVVKSSAHLVRYFQLMVKRKCKCKYSHSVSWGFWANFAYSNTYFK